MSQVQGLVGIGAAVFYHHQGGRLCDGYESVFGILTDGLQQAYPTGWLDAEVEETLHHIEPTHHRGQMAHQILTDILGRILRFLAAYTQEGEHHQGQFSLKSFSCLLQDH